MSVVLIGYRGSGKTSAGRKLANALWQQFVDTDELVVAAAGGKSIRDIFEQDGEARFRQLEAEAVREACLRPEHVIAVGGGAVVLPENRSAIKNSGHKVIYLRCDLNVLLQRIRSDPASDATRPNLTAHGGGAEEVSEVLANREPLYREMMHAELDVTHLSLEEVVQRLARML